MSTITKEWLQQNIAEYEANRDELPFWLDTNSAIELQAFKLALASLEAEPVAYIRDGFRADGVHFCGGIITAEEHERTKPALSDRYNWKHQPLYTAPPAPVSDSLLSELLGIAKRAADEADECAHAEFSDDSMEHSAAIADWERRAAMLQGAEPVTTGCKLPDGWVVCSERMPTKQDGTVFLTWNGQYIGKELFLMGSFQCLKPEIITHWMPLPAAPRQEVK